MFSYGLFLLICTCACASAGFEDGGEANAVARGAQIRLTKSGLQYMADIGVKALQQKINNLHIPNLSGGGHHFTWDASNVIVHSLTVGAHSFIPLPNVGVKLSVRGVKIPVSLHAHAKYRYHFVKISSHTDVDASANGVSLDISLKVTASGSGKPHVAAVGCSGGVADLGLHFHGGHAWLWKLVQGPLKSYLRGKLSGSICGAVTKAINSNVNKYLDMFPTRMNIKSYAYVDYSLSQPSFTKDYMDFFVRGEILNFKHPVHSKLHPPQFQTTSSANKMVYIWLTDYTLNTAAEVFHNAKLLTRVIKVGDKIPSGVKPFLNTRFIKGFIPQLYNKYPDRPIRISLETFQAPTFQLRPGQASASLYVRAGINVELKDKSLVSVFHLDLSVSGKGTASIKKIGSSYNVAGNINAFTFKIAVGGSIIGKVNLPVNNPSIQALVKGLVVEQANPYLNNGFSLPQSSKFQLTSPALTIVQSAIRVDSNVVYHL